MSTHSHSIITVTGDLGSGKSHVCRLLAEQLGSNVVSTGTIQRDIARDLNVSTLELNKISETSPEIDRRIDGQIIALAGSENLICDSRLAWHFLPKSLKVCLIVSTEVAAQRVFSDNKRSGEKYSSVEEAIIALKARRASELHRFKQTYDVELDNLRNFDLVIDTSHATPEAICKLIIQHLQQSISVGDELLKKNGTLWLPPASIYPTRLLGPDDDVRRAAVIESVKNTGYDPLQPVQVLTAQGLYFICDGHIRTSAALVANLDWLTAQLVATGDELLAEKCSTSAYALQHSTLPIITEWENAHLFKFSQYPVGG